MDAYDSNSDIQEHRPPIYNAEDYILGLKKFSKLTGLQLYLDSPLVVETAGTSINDKKSSDLVTANNRRNKHGFQQPFHDQEMGLKQFSTITDLLIKLKDDLTLSFPSFIREFIGASNDGVTHLLDALKAIQLAQTNITGSLNQLGSRANHVMFKKALSDEFETLLCLKICAKFEDGALKLVEHHSGLFTVAVCVMSNYSKSRVLSLQLLTRLCDMDGGHKQVSDAISMLRLRFGEPVRLKFLVGMLNSYNSSAFHISCLRFLNRFVETSRDTREKILIQTELEEAGFDLLPLKKMLLQASAAASLKDRNDLLQEELDRWANNYIDVNALVKKLLDAERANRKLREEISGLKDKYRQSEEDRKRCKATLERLRYELNTEQCDCNNERDLDLAQVETEECSLVTVLASDGYTCITSPVISNRSITIHNESSDDNHDDKESSEPKEPRNSSSTASGITTTIDSGLSSEEDARHHLSSSSSSSNDEIKTHDCNSSDKSSYSEKQEKESAKETEADRLQDPDEDEDDIDVVYAERNVLQEEATTVEAETITVDRFRQRFIGTVDRSSGKKAINAVNNDLMNSEQHPKYKAPPPPPRQRRTSSSSTTIKASLELIHVNSEVDLDRESHHHRGFEIRRPKSVASSHQRSHTPTSDYSLASVGPSSDVAIVPKRGPRPPARKRPKSTPIPQSIHIKPDRKRSEMVFLPDLSDGETSDGGLVHHHHHHSQDFDEEENVMIHPNGGAGGGNTSSNCNTLETMSARSFGFIKPSQKIRDNDMASRIRRHKSFFDTSSITTGGNQRNNDIQRHHQQQKSKPRPLSLIRRAESFHHSRSLGDFDRLLQHQREESPKSFHYNNEPIHQKRGKSVDRFLNHDEQQTKKLQKSKSMEFLKAKLLSRKPSTKSQVQPIVQHNHGPLDPRLFHQVVAPPSGSPHGRNNGEIPKYDWRQDTPFWNNNTGKNRSNNKPQVPANKPRLREEPWTQLHAGPASLWPAGQHGYPPGLFFGRKAGIPGSGNNFYPSFSVANPKNPSNISRNIVLPPPNSANNSRLPQPQYHPVYAAAAAAAAAQAAAVAQAQQQKTESLKDRLEITELSDAETEIQQEPLIPAPDYRRTVTPSSVVEMGSSSHSSGSQHGKILDIPSGLY